MSQKYFVPNRGWVGKEEYLRIKGSNAVTSTPVEETEEVKTSTDETIVTESVDPLKEAVETADVTPSKDEVKTEKKKRAKPTKKK